MLIVSERMKQTNYKIAKAEADKVDEIIIDTIKEGDLFVLKLALAQEKHIP